MKACFMVKTFTSVDNLVPLTTEFQQLQELLCVPRMQAQVTALLRRNKAENVCPGDC